MKSFFTRAVLRWNSKKNNRTMPWKGEKDPYKIWLSEIILQQTRVDQGWDYYNRFLTSYPTIGHLAKAPAKNIYKHWEGLGYYSRCKNLILTAKFIHKEMNGKFPRTYDELLALKGVGPYTAAAIASFAFNLPYAVVDGNVFRVLSRFFGIKKVIDNNDGKKYFTSLANDLLDKRYPGNYNQAIMDFGAVICTPKNPGCKNCPLKSKCVANIEGLTDKLPIKKGIIERKSRWFYYLVIKQDGKVQVRKRSSKDIWQNLYEFVLLEAQRSLTIDEIKDSAIVKSIIRKSKTKIIDISKLQKQQLTHQIIQGRFIYVRLKNEVWLPGYKAISINKLAKLPFPKFITGYLSENEPWAFER